MKNWKWISLALVFVALVSESCKKDEFNKGNLTLKFAHEVDGSALAYNTIQYSNAAGYDYSCTRLEYYVSDIKLWEGGTVGWSEDSVYYIDAMNNVGTVITFGEVPFGDYTRITFHVGMDSLHNASGSLPNTTANNAMAWPDLMGGGYHFMKFEGNYRDSAGTVLGFAMHLGKNGHQTDCYDDIAFSFDQSGQELKLTMNLNEWFQNPQVYDFNVDGTSIMMNDAAMEKLSSNGDDVFNH